MANTMKKKGKRLIRCRVPFCSRPCKVIIAAKGKGSYHRAREKSIPMEKA